MKNLKVDFKNPSFNLTKDQLAFLCENDFKNIKINKDVFEILDKQLNKKFKEIVPFEGKTGTMGGELLRAISKIEYRYYNDGDKLNLKLEGYCVEHLVHGILNMFKLDEFTGIKLIKQLENIFTNKGNYELKLNRAKYLILNALELSEFQTKTEYDVNGCDEILEINL